MVNKCPKCGNMLPAGAAYCGKCGASLLAGMRKCPECHRFIPAKSVFCPLCGKMVRNDFAPEPVVLTPEPNEKAVGENKSSVVAEDEKQPKKEIKPTVNISRDDVLENKNNKSKDNGRKNKLISISLVLVIVILVVAVYDWNSGSILHNEVQEQTLADESELLQQDEIPMSMEEAAEAYRSIAMHGSHGDEDSRFAVAAYSNLRGKERIVGIDFNSDENRRSYYRIKELVRLNGEWQSLGEIVKYIDRGLLIFNRDSLGIANENIPRIMELDGKLYFYFVYLIAPFQDASRGECHLMPSLYNIETKDVIQADFICRPVNRGGRKMYRGEMSGNRETPEFRFLSQELARYSIIYRPTAEEMELEAPKNAVKKWAKDNEKALQELKDADVATTTFVVTLYDSPLFAREEVDTESLVENESYMFYVTHAGAVFGYNRSSREFFIAYVDMNGNKPVIDMKPGGMLHVVAGDMDFDLDPVSCKVVKN